MLNQKTFILHRLQRARTDLSISMCLQGVSYSTSLPEQDIKCLL